MAVVAAEALDGRLAVDHGGDDVTAEGVRPPADSDSATITDGRVDHGVADQLECEHLTFADQLLRRPKDILDIALGGDGGAGGDPVHRKQTAVDSIP